MSKRRLMFSKLNMAKFISHLDLLRCFTRSIMRSGLPVKYSQGFNPHQKITFSLPLSIGVTGERECVDIDFEDGASNEEIMERLNQNLPPDIRIISVGTPVKSANDIVSAEYEINLISDEPINSADVEEFFGRDEVIILKKTKKKGEQPANLMDFVKGCTIEKSEETEDGFLIKLRLILSAGGQSNLKPEIAVKALADNIKPKITAYDINRSRIFCMADGILQEFD